MVVEIEGLWKGLEIAVEKQGILADHPEMEVKKEWYQKVLEMEVERENQEIAVVEKGNLKITAEKGNPKIAAEIGDPEIIAEKESPGTVVRKKEEGIIVEKESLETPVQKEKITKMVIKRM